MEEEKWNEDKAAEEYWSLLGRKWISMSMNRWKGIAFAKAATNGHRWSLNYVHVYGRT